MHLLCILFEFLTHEIFAHNEWLLFYATKFGVVQLLFSNRNKQSLNKTKILSSLHSSPLLRGKIDNKINK